MTAYTPKLDLLDTPDDVHAPDAPASARPDTPPSRLSQLLMRLLVGLVLAGIIAFVAIKVGRLYGYDLVQSVQNLGRRSPTFVPAQATASQATPGIASATATPVRDMPPQVDPNKPDFSLRDGVTYGYITNLDSETLQRLDGVVDQLDQMVGYTEQMGQAVSQFAAVIVPRMQQVEQQQAQLTRAMTHILTQLQRIDASVQDVRMSLLQPSLHKTANTAPKGPVIRDWSVQSIHNGRAWLKSPSGTVVTVVKGERLQALGEIDYVDERRIVLTDGRYIE